MKISKEFLRKIFHGEASLHTPCAGYFGLFFSVMVIGSFLGFIILYSLVTFADFIKSLIQ